MELISCALSDPLSPFEDDVEQKVSERHIVKDDFYLHLTLFLLRVIVRCAKAHTFFFF